MVHDISSSNFILTVDLGELIMLPPQNLDEPVLVQNVIEEDQHLGDEEADDELDEDDDLLIDFCEDDVNVANEESDSD